MILQKIYNKTLNLQDNDNEIIGNDNEIINFECQEKKLIKWKLILIKLTFINARVYIILNILYTIVFYRVLNSLK